MRETAKVFLSVVLPCHNEEEVIQSTYRRLRELIRGWEKDLVSRYEIVMVNNGSTDATLEKMLEIRREDQNVVILDLRRNFGYQGSITAGLFNASGEVVVSIDADLQDDPAKIGEMIQQYRQGYDLVLGVRSDRTTDSFFKRITANLYYRFLKLMGIPSVSNHGDFRLMSRSLLEDLKQFGERNRYLRGLIFQVESRYACVYYKRTPRQAGKTKFRPLSLFSLAWDGITSFSNVPVKMVLFFGVLLFLASLVGIAYVLLMKYVYLRNVPGWASILTFFLFFSGIQNLFLGVIGEYISKIFIEAKQRPLYLVRRRYQGDQGED